MTSPSRSRSVGIRQDESDERALSSARLASPLPSIRDRARLPDTPTEALVSSEPLPQSLPEGSYPKQSQQHSAIAAALSGRPSSSLSNRDDGSHGPSAPGHLPPDQRQQGSNYGSFRAGPRDQTYGSPRAFEDFDVVRRHLAGPSGAGSPYDGTPELGTSARSNGRHDSTGPSKAQAGSQPPDDEEFSSLKMLGGDVTREIYRRTEAESIRKPQRSRSMLMPRADGQDAGLDYEEIHQPGGFRREHLRRIAPSPRPSHRRQASSREDSPDQQPSFVPRSFYEHLSLFGHFAGKSVEDDEEDSDYNDSRSVDEDPSAGERRPLLAHQAPKARRKEGARSKTGTAGTVATLTKSFVGTGVLFLPRAFLNGGMLFSFLVLMCVSAVSYYCFLLLTTSRLRLKGSFAEMGRMTYGKGLRTLINISLVVSQIGFASAYIVFTSENLRAFIMAVSNCETIIDMKYMILMQLIIFLPLSLYRNLNNISFIVYIADVFIVLGLVYLYYYGISTLVVQRGISDIELFNRDSWTLFIGTAIFTFEGVGLIIPIQDGMKKPQQLPFVLGGVMIFITVVFISMGALSYAAYGSKTETVIILNMNQNNKFVNALQFLYSLAILLSTPMQIFPAITILEHSVFTKSGKYSKFVKWRKNFFRFIVVMVATFIAWIGANDLDKFVALVGSFACIPLVYIYPPLIHSKAAAHRRWEQLADYTLCLVGFCLMAYTSALTVKSWATGNGEKASPGFCDRR